MDPVWGGESPVSIGDSYSPIFSHVKDIHCHSIVKEQIIVIIRVEFVCYRLHILSIPSIQAPPTKGVYRMLNLVRKKKVVHAIRRPEKWGRIEVI